MLRYFSRAGVAAATLAGLTAFAGSASAANLVQNGDFNSPGASNAILLQQGNTFVTDWTNYDQYTGYIPQGQTADQDWQGLGTDSGAAGPGYGIDNGLVGPPSGDARLVIDGTYGFGPGGSGYGYVQPTISGLVSGATYTLTYWLAGSQEIHAGGATTQSFTVTLSATSRGTRRRWMFPREGFAPWQEVTQTFTWDGVGNTFSSFRWDRANRRSRCSPTYR